MRTTLLLVALVGCQGPMTGNPTPMTPTSGELKPLLTLGDESEAGPVGFNPGQAPLGKVQAVVEGADATAVFSDLGALMLKAGAVAGTDSSVRAWVSATHIPALDGTGEWLVGLSSGGKLYRLRDDQSLEDLTGRFGLETLNASWVGRLGATRVVFAISDGVLIAEGTATTRFSLGAWKQLATSEQLVAGLFEGEVRVLDASAGTVTRFALPDAIATALDAEGHLWAATSHRLYREKDGALALAWDGGAANIHGLVASGTSLWLAVDTTLYSISGEFLRPTSVSLAASAQLLPSLTGQVWTLTEGTLSQTMLMTGQDEAQWNFTVRPIHDAVCITCHGSGHVPEMATYAQWKVKRALIAQKLESKLMPQYPMTMTDEQRAAAIAWARATP